ncbi:hypothetical protein TW65_011045 [Stemphylium lycopersici]|uniref:CWF19-like protein mug161 n=1 Tax=Stemphylium lycopersici TaxID=183478 RepID=A0A364N7N7_STELY|nr:hypothetical protein TW65_011045 [Stemphylium lycopersici]RAR13319.1 CWF19-like protein mug161 [Stemphylium lycopersici]
MCDCVPLPIVCFQCGTDQNPCHCKVIGPTIGFVITVGMAIVCWPASLLCCCCATDAGKRLHYFDELTDYDMFESNPASWNLEELGYAYDAPNFHPDGRIEGGLHPPEYYAYSPHAGSWQDGLQDIDDFDWPSEQYDHRLPKTQDDPEQSLGEVPALKGVVSPSATTSGESSISADRVSGQAKSYQPEINLGDQVQNSDWLSSAIENTPGTSTPAALSPHFTSPPSITDSVSGQVSNGSVPLSPASLNAQAGVVESEEQDDKISDGADGLRTSLASKFDCAKQQKMEEDSEARVVQDEKSINGEATSENKTTSVGDNITSVENPASFTLPTSESLGALQFPDTKSKSLVQKPSEVDCINGNSMSPEVSDFTHIAEDVVSMRSGELEGLSLLQTKDSPKEEEKLPGPAEAAQNLSLLGSIPLSPQENTREIRRESDLGTGSSNAAALPVAYLPKAPIGKTSNSPSPENLERLDDDFGAQRQAQLQDGAEKAHNGVSGLAVSRQQYAGSLTLPLLLFQREEDVDNELGSETSALSDAPSFDTNATLCLTPNGLARNSTTAVPTEGAYSDGSAVTTVKADTPTKTLRLRLKIGNTDSRKHLKRVKKANSTSDTDSDVPPKKKKRQGACREPSLQVPTNLSGETIFGTEAELQQPHNDDGDTEEHYSDVETPSTPPGQAFVPIPSTKTARSRPKVSNRELEGLIPTKYRERASKARNQGQPIARQLFASQKKPDGLGMLLTSAKALEKSPASTKNKDNLTLVEDAGTAGNTSKVSTRSKKKTPAGRATRKRKISAVEQEPDSRPARKTSAAKKAGEKQATAPPNTKKNTTRATKSKGAVLKDTEKDEILVSAESKPPPETPTQAEMESASEYAESHQAPEAEASEADDDESCAATMTTMFKKSKARNKTLALGAQAAGRNKHGNDAPAASVVSSSGTPGANKYGFTQRRGPKKAAAAGSTPSTSRPAAVSKAAAAPSKTRETKRKGKGV